MWSQVADSAQSVFNYSVTTTLSTAWNAIAFPPNTKHEFIDPKKLELMDVAKFVPNLEDLLAPANSDPPPEELPELFYCSGILDYIFIDLFTNCDSISELS